MWANLSEADRDRAAWDALHDWPRGTDVECVRDGIDHAALARALLWGKIGRAIRASANDASYAFEKSLSDIPEGNTEKSGTGPTTDSNSLRRVALNAKLAAARRTRSKRVLYCPFPYSRNARIIERLLETKRDYAIVVPASHAAQWPGAIPWRSEPKDSPGGDDAVFRDELFGAVIEGLEDKNVNLLQSDADRLRDQLGEQVSNLRSTTADLERLKPDAILVPTDNHSPFMEHVLVARKLGIATVMLQHGLDCEYRYLDEAFASHVALWGENRRDRYAGDSSYQPELMRVVGNPAYDDLPPLQSSGDVGCQWLWLTRPHRPEKCYWPSREPVEGLDIFDAILKALERRENASLVIKAHTFDYADVYRERLEQSPVRDRVSFPDAGLFDLIDRADVVITEDSTAGMDAMVRDRVVVHAHFSKSPSVMPFVDYGAALPGFTTEEVEESLCRSADLSFSERKGLRDGRRAFLRDFAGPLDGRAGERFVDFVAEVLAP